MSEQPSRRAMLRLGGAAAVGAAMAAATRAGAVGAADDAPLLIAQTNSTDLGSTDTTVLRYANAGAIPQVPIPAGGTNNANLFTVRDDSANLLINSSASGFPAAVGGYSYRTTPNGVFGFTQMIGAGVIGVGTSQALAGVYGRSNTTAVGAGAGVRAQSTNGPNLLLEPTAATVPTAGTWATGSMLADTAGHLWFCTSGGTPGTWVDLATGPPSTPPTSVVSFVALTPFRAYDSREALPIPGPLGAPSTRTITVKDQRAVAGGAVTSPDRIPATATAVTANVTVVNTVGAGFLAANPGGSTTVSAATINWYESGQILNNGVTLALGASLDLTVIAGGLPGTQTDFVVDITGYFTPILVG